MLAKLGADTAEVLACYDTAIAINPRLAPPHHNRGDALTTLKADPREVVAAHTRAIALNPR